ncbi:MAG TPA: hypothetical protein DCQ30_02715 [Acidimicrobiaceae bacterium]|nr:hypothetical protein [Acidimicrobiaceae bacterium]
MSSLVSRVRDGVTRSVQSVTSRKYLVGAVLAWVLVVYLASSPSLRSAQGPTQSPVHPAPAGPAAGFAVPSFSAPNLSTAPLSSSGFGSFVAPPLSFGAPPAPPATTSLSCPFPIPQSQTTPFDPGVFLSFGGPFIELSGPLVSYYIPTLGAIAPLVPIVTPLVYISEPVMNAVTPDVSTVVTDYVTIIDAAGLNSPQEQQYAAEFEPYWLQLVGSLTPVEQQLSSSTAGQCLVLFENELAVMDSQQNLPALPSLPYIPSGIPPGSSQAAVAQAAAADTRSPFAQLTVPWSGGIPSGLPAAVSTLRGAGKPVLVQLVDQPPAGQAMGGTGFPDFVAQVVHELPAASAFEVDAPATDPSGTGQMADLVHGLASADLTRMPGQLIGAGVPTTAQGTSAVAFWGAFKGAMKGLQANMVDFVAADLTPLAEATAAADSAEAAQSARSLESSFTTLGGVPADVPVFGTVSLDGADPATVASVQEQIASYLAALRGLHVSALGVFAG